MIALDCGLDPVCWFKEAVGFIWERTIGYLVRLIEDAIIAAISEAVAGIVRVVAQFWTEWRTPDPEQLSAVSWMNSQIQPIAAFFAVLGFLFAGAKTIWMGRREPLVETGKAMVVLALVSAGFTGFMSVMIDFADVLTVYIFNDLFDNGTSLEDSIKDLVVMNPSLGLVLILTLGITAIIVAGVQIALMVLRSAGLVLVSGVLPLAVAATNTQMGQRWFKHILGYCAMFIFYKPAAATVYGTAIAMTKNQPLNAGDAEIMLNAITGITMMCLSVVLMPALMRLIAPMSSK